MADAVKHGVVNTESMWAVYNMAGMRSFVYVEEGTEDGKTVYTNPDIDNGHVVELKLPMIDRDVWTAVKPTAKTPLENLALVATPEVMYDERLSKYTWQYYNIGLNKPSTTLEYTEPISGPTFHANDIFSVSLEALDTALTKIVPGNTVELQADTKLKVVATATAGATKIGTVIDVVERKDGTFIGIQVVG